VKIQFENVDFNSSSGPNGFGLKLARELVRSGHEITADSADVRLSFIQSANNFNPTVLRLDGIYFNSLQDWERMNAPIKKSYDYAQAVVVQSEFDKKLIFEFFGERDNVHVIHNGTDVDLIKRIPSTWARGGLPQHFSRESVWMCASSWRPHKRLTENIRLFHYLKKTGDVLFIAGHNAHASVEPGTDLDGVHFLGNLTWETMIAWMKSAGNFIHLAWLDHCPNVVVDARVAGCKLHVSDAGGTAEIVDAVDKVYADADFNFNPVELYNPPRMTFELSKDPFKLVKPGIRTASIRESANKYIDVLKSVI